VLSQSPQCAQSSWSCGAGNGCSSSSPVDVERPLARAVAGELSTPHAANGGRSEPPRPLTPAVRSSGTPAELRQLVGEPDRVCLREEVRR